MSNFSEDFNKNRSQMGELELKRKANQEKLDIAEDRLDELYNNSENRTKQEEAEVETLVKQRNELAAEDLRLGEKILKCLEKEMELIS